MNNDTLIKRLAKTLSEVQTKKTSPYDTQAEVRRVDGDVAWVHIPGGVEETPVQLTTSAKKGDVVQVRVSGGRAWLYGNVTSPPTDDTRANEAKKTAASASEHAINAVTEAGIAKEAAINAVTEAGIAKEAANNAVVDAGRARDAAEQAEATAESVHDIAVQASIDADEAKRSANNANLYATSALTNLGVVENVLDTLDWITKHGYYQLTEDTSVVANKIYYSLTGAAIASPTGNPSLNLYYERSGSGTEADPYVYALSADTAVDDQKTYYSVSAVSIAEPTGNPSENGYYELQMNSALSQYVASHLALTDKGLTITNDQSAGSMLLSTTGVEIKNAGGITVGKYGESAIIGAENAGHIEIKNGEIYFYSGAKTEMTPYDPEADPFCVAYVSNNELHIPRIIVIETLKMGDWRWDATIENHLSLNWIGG